TSVFCTLPAVGVLIGYSGARKGETRGDAIRTSVYFTIGTIIALMIIGLVAGFIGQVAQSTLGRYWKLFAGVIAVLFGLATLNLFPIKIQGMSLNNDITGGRFGTALTGLVLGGIIAACSLPCNPGIFIVISAAILQGQVVWSILLMSMFAIGFSIPIGAIIMGVSLGKVSFAAKGIDKILRYTAGIILVVAGFYFLVTY
ncbi:MAG: cytochrome c biogenesis protein CcdA, partial [Elusimicrobiota bacterium]